MREVRTMEQAAALIEEWAIAYRELQRAHLRLQERCEDYKWLAEHHAFTLRHLDPFLPPPMQDAALRAADPKVYRSIAELVCEQWAVKRRSPFDEPETIA
jgi:hypothetical protein